MLRQMFGVFSKLLRRPRGDHQIESPTLSQMVGDKTPFHRGVLPQQGLHCPLREVLEPGKGSFRDAERIQAGRASCVPAIATG